jgi:hypothetical protein
VNRDDVITRLTDEFKYPAKGAQLVATKLQALTLEIRPYFEAWWFGGPIPDLQIEGFTVRKLMEEHGMNPIASFLTLDWLAREPEKALASLRKGHDKISQSRPGGTAPRSVDTEKGA